MIKRLPAAVAAVAMTVLLTLSAAASDVSVDFVKSYMRGGQLYMQYAISCLYSGSYSAELVDEAGMPVAAWSEQPIDTQPGAEAAVKSFTWSPEAAPEGSYRMIVTTENIYGQTAATSTTVSRTPCGAGEAPVSYGLTGIADGRSELPAASTPNAGVYMLEGGVQGDNALLTVARVGEAAVFELRSITDTGENRLAGLLDSAAALGEGGLEVTLTAEGDTVTVGGAGEYDGVYVLSDIAPNVGREAAALYAGAVLEGDARADGELVDGWFWPVAAGGEQYLAARDMSAIFLNGKLIQGDAAPMLVADKLISEFGEGNCVTALTAAGVPVSQPEEQPYYTPYVRVTPLRSCLLAGQQTGLYVQVPGGLDYEITALSSDRGKLSFGDGVFTAVEPGFFTVSGTITVAGASRDFEFDMAVTEPHIAFTSVPPTLSKKYTHPLSAVVVGGDGEVEFSLSDESVAAFTESGWLEGLSDGVVTLTARAGGLETSADVAVGTTKLYADEAEAEAQEGEEPVRRFSWVGFFVGSGIALTTVMLYFLHKHNREMGIDARQLRK